MALLSQVPGNDDTYLPGIQNDPQVGARFEPVDILADEEFVRDYINATGDETYWAFRASTRARFGLDVAPLTVFDRDIGARLVGISSRFALHAKQTFEFRGPVTPGRKYRLTGEMTDVFEKRGIQYFTTTCTCHPIDEPDNIILKSLYTRAFKFPENQYQAGREARSSRVSDWLQNSGAKPRVSFPEVGAIVEGRTRHLSQARLNLYSGPGSGVHTDNLLARQGGLEGTVGQALMLTQLESELYRDLFGFDFYTKGAMEDSFISTIPVNCEVRAVTVVESVDDGGMKLRSAVATTTGKLLSVGRASISQWP